MAVCLNPSPLKIFKVFSIDNTECLLCIRLYVNFVLKEEYPNFYFTWIKLTLTVKLTHKSRKEKYLMYFEKGNHCLYFNSVVWLSFSWFSLFETNSMLNLESMYDKLKFLSTGSIS